MRPGMQEVIVILLPQLLRIETVAGRIQHGYLPIECVFNTS
jgi:hypothetical protein